MPKFRSGNLSLYYEDYNKEAPEAIIFVHPAPLDHFAWIYQVPHFSQNYRVIVLDQRCFGLSDKPEYHFDISDFGRDLEALFLSLSLKPSYIVGLSLGGIASQFLALKAPSLVKALVLADTLSSTKNSSVIKERVRKFEQLGIGGYYDEAVLSLCSKKFIASDVGRYFLQLFSEKSKNLSNASIIRCYQALSKLDLTDELQSIHVPTLVIAGSEDYAFLDSQLISQKIDNSKFVSIPDTGHITQIEAPATFNSLVTDFIRKFG